MSFLDHPPFDRESLRRGALFAAPRLLGAMLAVRDAAGEWRVARIVEAEAYTQDDPASHSHRGVTLRNRAMFAHAGTAYVYLSYGVHHCFNVVTGEDGVGEAVLVRAVEPLEGVESMIAARGWHGRDLRRLCDGPGKVCRALGIGPEHDGVDLLEEGTLRLLAGERVDPAHIAITPRIGITKAAEWPRRFVLGQSPARTLT